MTHGRADIHRLLLDHGLRPSRALGQNFVADPNTVRRIVRLAGVGPGAPGGRDRRRSGSLTLALAEAGARVTAVEIDRHVVPVLRGAGRAGRACGWSRPTPCAVDWAELLAAGPAGAVARWWPTSPTTWPSPLVIRVLEEAPQVASLLVMVQREVGERHGRRGGRRGLRGGVGEGRLLGHGRGGRAGPGLRLRAPAQGGVGSGPAGPPTGRAEPAVPRACHRTIGSSRWSGPGSPSGARCSGGPWPAWSHPEAFAGAGIRPEARAEELSVGEWEQLAAWTTTRDRPATCPARRSGARRAAEPGPGEVVAAPAKLTLSLRVLGVRPDGFHLLEAEMVSPRPGRHLCVRPGAGRPVIDRGPAPPGPGAPGPSPSEPDNLVARALAAVGRRAGVRLVKRIPFGGGLGGGSSDAAACCAGPGGPTWTWPPAWGPTCRSAWSAAGPGSAGSARSVEPLPYEERSFTLLLPPFGVDTAAVYRAWDRLATGASPAGRGGNDLDGGGAGRRAPPGPRGATAGQVPRAGPALAGSGSTWFVEGTARGAGPGRPARR